MPKARLVTWAPRAKRDLRDIWGYYARVASPEIADKLLREISEAGERLGQRSLPG
ncbi:MAG: type II toxin-antitoxin system RelE/ParE family toxin [Methylobacteriaceae bacterium]|nr:type II toxin-antitoxin system RelE/ParE family toxin [Methylobacteriaceae bacterium]